MEEKEIEEIVEILTDYEFDNKLTNDPNWEIMIEKIIKVMGFKQLN